MTHTPSSSLRRRTTAACAALLLGLALAACGAGGSDDEADESPSASTSETTSESPSETATSEPVEPTESTGAEPAGDLPSDEDLQAALLTTADVPAGLTAQPDDGDDSDDEESFEGTCLADVGEFSDALGFEADSEAEVEYVTEDADGQTSVSSKLQAYADAAAVGPAFAEFTDRLQGCTEVTTTDDQGIDYQLQIGYDDSVDLPGAEDQLRIQMTGTISSGEQSFDVTFRIVVSLSGPILSVVGVSTLGEADPAVLDTIDDLATTQAERVGALG